MRSNVLVQHLSLLPLIRNMKLYNIIIKFRFWLGLLAIVLAIAVSGLHLLCILLV